jgi:glycosyltransferase involved in cell wall biosynthesis
VKPGDSKALARAVLKLYNDRELARVLGWNGLSYVSKNLTSDHIGNRMYNILLSAIK